MGRSFSDHAPISGKPMHSTLRIQMLSVLGGLALPTELQFDIAPGRLPAAFILTAIGHATVTCCLLGIYSSAVDERIQ
jgi:hypothetical protein